MSDSAPGQYVADQSTDRAARRVRTTAAVLLLAVVAALVAVHLAAYVLRWREVTSWDPLHKSLWSVEKDRGYAELWGYAVQAGIVLCLGMLLLGRRRRVYAAWGAVFGIALLDDGLHLHERLGGLLVRGLGLPVEVAGLDRQSLGELAVFGLLSALPLLAVVHAHRCADAEARRHTGVLALLLAALVFFGVVVDVLHGLVGVSGDVAMAVGLVEDGGELVVLSVTLAVLAGWVVVARRTASHQAAQQPIVPIEPRMVGVETMAASPR